MMVIIYIIIIGIVSVGLLVGRRLRPEEIRETTYEYPSRMDQRDIVVGDKEVLLVVFTSHACDSCRSILELACSLETDQVALINIEYEDPSGRQIHEKYQISAVPTLLVCSGNGEVFTSFIGHVSKQQLVNAISALCALPASP